MLDESKEKQLYTMFFALDDFCTALADYERSSIEAQAGRRRRRGPQARLALSEELTILCFYHYSGFKCFQYYYETWVLGPLRTYFPKVLSYTRFIERLPRLAKPLALFSTYQCLQSVETGVYFCDSKKLPVCDVKRIHANRVFKDVAARGKSSTGWFYGFKLHLVINNLGQILRFCFTPANVADNNQAVLDALFARLQGLCFGDKGYLTKFFATLYEQGLQLVTRLRKNMKNVLMPLTHKRWLRKRAVIESVNDLLMTVFDIDHTRHRSPWNALIHALAGVVAYGFYPHKPAVFIPRLLS